MLSRVSDRPDNSEGGREDDMSNRIRLIDIPAIAAAMICLTAAPEIALAQTTDIQTEYLMTIHAPLEAPQVIDGSLFIYNVRDGGWAKGPKIRGKLIPPGADWLQVLPSGVARLDVRATIETDDGALLYLSYNGVIKGNDITDAKQEHGEVVKAGEMYFLTAPTLRTASEKYAWLNAVQCIGKMVELKSGEDAYVTYDIFIAR